MCLCKWLLHGISLSNCFRHIDLHTYSRVVSLLHHFCHNVKHGSGIPDTCFPPYHPKVSGGGGEAEDDGMNLIFPRNINRRSVERGQNEMWSDGEDFVGPPPLLLPQPTHHITPTPFSQRASRGSVRASLPLPHSPPFSLQRGFHIQSLSVLNFPHTSPLLL